VKQSAIQHKEYRTATREAFSHNIKDVILFPQMRPDTHNE